MLLPLSENGRDVRFGLSSFSLPIAQGCPAPSSVIDFPSVDFVIEAVEDQVFFALPKKGELSQEKRFDLSEKVAGRCFLNAPFPVCDFGFSGPERACS